MSTETQCSYTLSELSGKKVSQLYDICKTLKLQNYRRKRKQVLINLIYNGQPNKPTTEDNKEKEIPCDISIKKITHANPIDEINKIINAPTNQNNAKDVQNDTTNSEKKEDQNDTTINEKLEKDTERENNYHLYYPSEHNSNKTIEVEQETIIKKDQNNTPVQKQTEQVINKPPTPKKSKIPEPIKKVKKVKKVAKKQANTAKQLQHMIYQKTLQNLPLTTYNSLEHSHVANKNIRLEKIRKSKQFNKEVVERQRKMIENRELQKILQQRKVACHEQNQMSLTRLRKLNSLRKIELQKFKHNKNLKRRSQKQQVEIENKQRKIKLADMTKKQNRNERRKNLLSKLKQTKNKQEYRFLVHELQRLNALDTQINKQQRSMMVPSSKIKTPKKKDKMLNIQQSRTRALHEKLTKYKQMQYKAKAKRDFHLATQMRKLQQHKQQNYNKSFEEGKKLAGYWDKKAIANSSQYSVPSSPQINTGNRLQKVRQHKATISHNKWKNNHATNKLLDVIDEDNQTTFKTPKFQNIVNTFPPASEYVQHPILKVPVKKGSKRHLQLKQQGLL